MFENTFDLSKTVIVPEGYTVYYWNSDTPINYLNKSADYIVNTLTWSTTPASNIRGIRVVANEGIILNPNESLDVIIPMVAPNNDTSNNFDLTGLRAYNSFVRKDSSTIRFLEPNKVYNELAAPKGIIEFTKWAQDSVVIDETIQYELEGATFELRDIDGNFVASAISDINGLVKFNDVPILNTYTIKEVKTLEGYILSSGSITVTYEDFVNSFNDTNEFKVVIDDATSRNNLLNIKPLYGSLLLEKVNSNNEPLSYIRFNIKGLSDSNKDFNQNYLTSTTGQIYVPKLIEGDYVLTEIVDVNSSGFTPIEPINFTIDENNIEIKYNRR